MGTRGAFGYHVDGADKVTYNHSDSYPGGLGEEILKYVKFYPAEKIAEVARKIALVDEKGTPSPELIEKYRRFANLSVGDQRLDKWYSLLREAQGRLECYHEGLEHMIDGRSFLADSLFCEWAYIVNVDAGEFPCLEIYKGFNENAEAPGRYAKFGSNGYQGVALIETIPLADLYRTRKSLSNITERLGNYRFPWDGNRE
jgi:hypothetical protein